MSIEFYCSECEAYLRAADMKAGLAISCPHCFARIWIPVETEPLELIDEDLDWEDSVEQNENDGELTLLDEEDIVLGPFEEPVEVDLGKILSDTWRIFTKNWRACFAVTVVDSLLTVAAVFVTAMIGGIAAAMAANRPETAVLAFFVVMGLGMGVMMSMFAVGHIRFYLDLCRDQEPELKKSVNFQGPVGKMFIGGIIYWGLFLLIFPPIFLWPYGRVLLDKKSSSTLGALATALRLTARHSGVCFALFLVKFGALFASALIPVAGAIIVTPYLATLNTVAYLHFTGELE